MTGDAARAKGPVRPPVSPLIREEQYLPPTQGEGR